MGTTSAVAIGPVAQLLALGALLLGCLGCSSSDESLSSAEEPALEQVGGNGGQAVAPTQLAPNVAAANRAAAIRVGREVEEEGESVRLQAGQTAYLPRYLGYFVVPPGWEGSGANSKVSLRADNGGEPVEVEGVPVDSMDLLVAAHRPTFVLDDNEEEPLPLIGELQVNREEGWVLGRYAEPSGSTAIVLTRSGSNNAGLRLVARGTEATAATELERAMRYAAASAVFEPSPWSERLVNMHFHDTTYISTDSYSTSVSQTYHLCDDGWGHKEGNVDSMGSYEDPAFPDADPTVVTTYVALPDWGPWTAHGELADGGFAIHLANGDVRTVVLSLDSMAEEETVRVGGEFWDQWSEACSVPSDVPATYEQRLTQELGSAPQAPSTTSTANAGAATSDNTAPTPPGTEYPVGQTLSLRVGPPWSVIEQSAEAISLEHESTQDQLLANAVLGTEEELIADLSGPLPWTETLSTQPAGELQRDEERLLIQHQIPGQNIGLVFLVRLGPSGEHLLLSGATTGDVRRLATDMLALSTGARF